MEKMDLNKIDIYLEKKDNDIDESSDEKKMQIYRDGIHSLRSAFQDFSQYYMRSMGQMQQGKSAMDSKYEKLRNKISSSYEIMEDAILKHMDIMNKVAIDTKKRG